jgi:hypothetical protein
MSEMIRGLSPAQFGCLNRFVAWAWRAARAIPLLEAHIESGQTPIDGDRPSL